MPLDLAVKDRIAVLTINLPEVMNAMDPETYRGLSEAWIEVRDNPEIWAAVITAANNAARGPEKQAFTSGEADRASGSAASSSPHTSKCGRPASHGAETERCSRHGRLNSLAC